MKAVRFIASGKPAEIQDVPAPKPGPGQVVVKIGGAGVCHSDLHILDGDFPMKGPFTLGHENAGWIAELGEGVKGWKEGDAVAVYGPWGCGRCHTCQLSAENYCENHASIPTMGGGLGSDGGMADYMLVPDARLLVSLGSLDPAKAAPLTDAALTPYHAIKAALPRLTPDTTVVVLGLGGLGHMAVQLLQALTPARLVACDISDDKLAQARKLGVQHTVNNRDAQAAASEIAKLAGPRGAVLALDLVGAQPTVDLCKRIVGRNARLSVVGLGGGVVHYGADDPPWGTEVNIPYWGTRTELMEVIAMAQAGRIQIETESFPLDQAVDVYQRLREGKIRGRAVLVP